MIQNIEIRSARWITVLALGAWGTTLFAPAVAPAQVFRLSREEMVEYTAQNPFDRFPDGRPKIPDALMERARHMSAEEVFAVLPFKGYRNQYEGGFHILHPGKQLVGRAFTAQFMPLRPDIDAVATAKGRAMGLDRATNSTGNQTVIDLLQPGDVLVVDLFGKKEEGTLVGDNLFYYVMKATNGGGLVVDGSIRDLEGISQMEMPAYYRYADPTGIANVMLTGLNVPIRIGNATVMPGDLVLGDREGVYFIPPHMVKEVVDNADVLHIHDEWTRMKFDEGKYKSSDIYGTPRDPQLKNEYQQYLKKRLEEIRNK